MERLAIARSIDRRLTNGYSQNPQLKCQQRLRNVCRTERSGGGGGIRTPETLSSLTVFKTAGFNRSPTPPLAILTHLSGKCAFRRCLVVAHFVIDRSPGSFEALFRG